MLGTEQNIYEKFNRFLTSQCGLFFKDYDLKNLEKIIAERCNVCNLSCHEDYYVYITTSDSKKDEFRVLLNRLTIQHTYFFRNESHFRTLKEKIIPELIKSKEALPTQNRSIQIWSAGCSTGQEPYSIAMIISDLFQDKNDFDVQIYATDISTDALKIAQEGIYNEKDMKLVNDNHKQNYFTRFSDEEGKVKYKIKDSIKKNVKFNYINLIENNYPQKLDIVFCRNVMIYFNKDDIKKITERFAKSLNTNGYLFIGCSESLKFITDRFKISEYKEGIFYQKIDGKTPATGLSKSKSLNKRSTIKKHTSTEKHADEIDSIIKDKINEALQLKDYQKASFLSEQLKIISPDTPEPYYFTAQIFANQGLFEKAKEQLVYTLRINDLFVPAYYMFGSIHAEEKDYEQAKTNFKNAIFLAPEFVLSHFAIAAVYNNSGNISDAMREYENTIQILSVYEPDDEIEYSGGFTAGTLKGICRNNIEQIKEGL